MSELARDEGSIPDFCTSTLRETAGPTLSMAQLLKLLPSNCECNKVSIKQALQQKRKHAAHGTVPLGLYKDVV
jgi:hypothetical protein